MRVLRRRLLRAVAKITGAKLIPLSIRSALGMSEVSGVGDKKHAPERRGKYWSLSVDQCAICAEDASYSITDPRHDVYTTSSWTAPLSSQPAPSGESPQFPLNTPYITSCSHQYCYVCLSERMLRAADEREPAWGCLRCEAAVLHAERVDMETVENRSDGDPDLQDASFNSEDFLTSTSE